MRPPKTSAAIRAYVARRPGASTKEIASACGCSWRTIHGLVWKDQLIRYRRRHFLPQQALTVREFAKLFPSRRNRHALKRQRFSL